MTRKFILLDQSIEGCTGHYLEYATRVLRAAKHKGFQTVLAVNKRAGDLACPDADRIEKTFSKTFWENQSQSNHRIIWNVLNGGSQVAFDKRLSRLFAEELDALLLRIGTNTDDLVFVPTLGAVELFGIASYSNLKNVEDLNWHFLFRRDLPLSESFFDLKEKFWLCHFKATLTEAAMRLNFDRFLFYADTEELTLQYNRLKIVDFQTLPIPINDSLPIKANDQSLPLIISYLGDAREEKGFHLLPRLISAVRSYGIDETRLVFRVQGNFPSGGGTRRVVRAKLALIDMAGVDVVEGPFESAIYHQLIVTSDIILIPYSRKMYVARSSGIFSEALAAGIPTVYPRGTWMESCGHCDGSLGFNGEKELPEILLKLISHHQKYKHLSWRYSHIWRQVHSAEKLVDFLVSRHYLKQAEGQVINASVENQFVAENSKP